MPYPAHISLYNKSKSKRWWWLKLPTEFYIQGRFELGNENSLSPFQHTNISNQNLLQVFPFPFPSHPLEFTGLLCLFSFPRSWHPDQKQFNAFPSLSLLLSWPPWGIPKAMRQNISVPFFRVLWLAHTVLRCRPGLLCWQRAKHRHASCCEEQPKESIVWHWFQELLVQAVPISFTWMRGHPVGCFRNGEGYQSGCTSLAFPLNFAVTIVFF